MKDLGVSINLFPPLFFDFSGQQKYIPFAHGDSKWYYKWSEDI